MIDYNERLQDVRKRENVEVLRHDRYISILGWVNRFRNIIKNGNFIMRIIRKRELIFLLIFFTNQTNHYFYLQNRQKYDFFQLSVIQIESLIVSEKLYKVSKR